MVLYSISVIIMDLVSDEIYDGVLPSTNVDSFVGRTSGIVDGGTPCYQGKGRMFYTAWDISWY